MVYTVLSIILREEMLAAAISIVNGNINNYYFKI